MPSCFKRQNTHSRFDRVGLAAPNLLKLRSSSSLGNESIYSHWISLANAGALFWSVTVVELVGIERVFLVLRRRGLFQPLDSSFQAR